MSPQTRALLTHLEQSHIALRQAVDSVPAGQREQKPAPDRWSVAEVLEHLAIVERRIAGRLSDALTAERSGPAAAPVHDESPILDDAQLAQFADRSQRFKTSEASEPKGGLTTEAAWAQLEAVRADVMRLVRESDGLALAAPIAPHPRFGPWTFRQWVVFAGGHDARHADQIREMA